jgi:hypothetical protein
MTNKDPLKMQPLDNNRSIEPVPPLPNAAVRAPFEVRRSPIRRDGDTEDLLNGLIAECHFAMREIAIPSACDTGDALTRRCFLSETTDLAKAGAFVGKTVAMLRAAGSPVVQGEVLEHVGQAIPAIEKKS